MGFKFPSNRKLSEIQLNSYTNQKEMKDQLQEFLILVQFQKVQLILLKKDNKIIMKMLDKQEIQQKQIILIKECQLILKDLILILQIHYQQLKIGSNNKDLNKTSTNNTESKTQQDPASQIQNDANKIKNNGTVQDVKNTAQKTVTN